MLFSSPTKPTSGEVFVYTCSTQWSHQELQVLSSPPDLFPEFYHDFLSNLTTSLIDAYIALFLNRPFWPDADPSAALGSTPTDKVARETEQHREAMRSLLRDRPPHILLLSPPPNSSAAQTHFSVGPFPIEQLSIDIPASDKHRYIALPKVWVDSWSAVVAGWPNGRETLEVETVLKSMIVHALGHWVFGLRAKPEASSVAVPSASAAANAFESLEARLRLLDISAAAPAVKPEFGDQVPMEDPGAEEFHTIHTKPLSPIWGLNNNNLTTAGEAGNFVELRGGGGVVGYDFGERYAYIQTQPTTIHGPLSIDHLMKLRHYVYVPYVPPPPTADAHQPPFVPVSPSLAYTRHPSLALGAQNEQLSKFWPMDGGDDAGCGGQAEIEFSEHTASAVGAGTGNGWGAERQRVVTRVSGLPRREVFVKGAWGQGGEWGRPYHYRFDKERPAADPQWSWERQKEMETLLMQGGLIPDTDMEGLGGDMD